MGNAPILVHFLSFTLSYTVLTHIHSPLPSPKIWTPTLKGVKGVPRSTLFPRSFFPNFAHSPGDFPDN